MLTVGAIVVVFFGILPQFADSHEALDARATYRWCG